MTDSHPTLNVLVIDDSEIARADMTHRLSQAGFKVSSLASPIGATRVIVDQAIDVVVIDVQMPSIRGDRLAALFKGNPRFSSLGVILVTGSTEAELDQLRASAQADAVLSKGKLDRLAAVVKDTYRKHHHHSSVARPPRG